MERVKRRWWTWAVSLLAAAVIFGAVVSGLFQLAVLALPSYRDDLSAWVTRVADRPVQIGGVSLVWRGVYPRLDLSGITLYTQAGEAVLAAERLSLGFSLLRLVRGDVLPNRIELAGLILAAEVDADGKLRVRGFENQGAQQDDWTSLVRRFHHVRLENCEVRLTDPRLEARDWPFRLRRLDLRQSEQGFALEGVMQLQSSLGGNIAFEADINGSLAQLHSWSGRFRAEAERVQPQGWLGHWLRPQVQLAAEALEVELEGRLVDGVLQHARLNIESGAVAVVDGVGSRMWQRLRGRAVLRAGDAGDWQLSLSRLQADDQDVARGALRVGAPREDGLRELDVDADIVNLDVLAPWMDIWQAQPAWAGWAGRTGGQVERLVLRLRPAAGRSDYDYSLGARLKGATLREDARFGVAGVNGELSADRNGGRLLLDDGPLQVRLPAVLSVPVAFDRAQAQLHWQRLASGWRVRVPGFDYRLRSLEGRGVLNLDLPENGGSPYLDLSAELSAGDARDAKPFLPRQWPEHLHEWLEHGIVAGRVPKGQLRIRGPLADFPYHERNTGQWSLDLDAVDGVLAYAPDWPQIRGISARLKFAGNGLSIDAQSGRTLGVPLHSGRATLDFSERVLQVQAVATGELVQQYEFLRASPLHKPLAALVDHTRAAGQSRVDLALEIPLRDVHETRVDGRVTIDNAQLFYGALDSPVSGISGVVAFTEHQVSAQQLSARFEDLPLTARIEPRENTFGVILMEFPFAPRPDAIGASKYLPSLLRSRIEGGSRWHGELALRDGTALELSSDLQGLAVDLPAPLGKTAEQAMPLRLRIGAGDDAAAVRLGVAYGQVLGVNMLLSAQEGEVRPAGLHARLGGTQVPQARVDSFVLDGRVAQLDVAALAALSGESNGERPRLDLADLQVERLRYRAAETGPLRLRYTPRTSGWHLQVDGATAQGTVDWARAGNLLSARLQRLDLRMIATPPPGDADAAVPAGDARALPAVLSQTPLAEPFDPARWPLLDLDCTDLRLGEVRLGRLNLRTSAMAGGQRLEQLALTGGDVGLQANGLWRRAEARSSAAFRFNLDTSAVGGLLTAFNYAPNLEAGRSRFSGELDWSPSARGLEWTQAHGRIEADVEDGQLRAVQPGGARVLGLINFYALPRRLTLNFKDVVGQGLSFDRIHGGFKLGDGRATTDNLDIAAPSLRMEVRGAVNLSAREYDQRVNVYPDVSAGVTLGAALLGGPALGALVLLAQELLDKPLDQATQLSYRVTGSWDNPRVDRIDGNTVQP